MKKVTLSAFVIGILLFNSCSSDDDAKTSENDCSTCNLEFLGESITSEFCDNGDGTMTITTSGVSEIEDLDGATFEQFITSYELLGATCN